MTQVILLGAGRGSRLGTQSGFGPKWMLEIEGLSLAQHLVNVFHLQNVTDINLVRGAQGGTVLSPSVAYTEVIDSPNMVHTLHEVRHLVRDDVIVAYCDLLLEPRVVQKVLEFTGDVGVVVDQHWQELFALRADDPLEIAESCRVVDGRLVELGQLVSPGQRPDAQYIGLVYFKLPIFQQLMRMYDELLDMTAGAPWRNSSSFVQAYLTDFLQEAIDRGYAVQPIEIEGGWFEFDTPRDLAAARQLALEPKPHVFDLKVLTTRPTVISAGGVAIRGSGDHREVLLVGSGEKGGWRIPKGMLEPGEAVEDAARREVLEEAGVPVKIEERVDIAEWTYDYGGRSWLERCFFFRMAAESESPPVPDSEHEVAAWVMVSDGVDGMRFAEERQALERAVS
ncbi:NUDIX domain-containing protein [Stappia sp. MMSF_3263]|uniref:NUDIX domain-containing protein n=1 Tax=Stappia sp. MMSF_3263 TaxID=3046693 RepID=UPI00273F8093|nr:NUDIX domain-containing protein [Stappia sp. MMSF_3263]